MKIIINGFRLLSLISVIIATYYSIFGDKSQESILIIYVISILFLVLGDILVIKDKLKQLEDKINK